jgi:hypothetical protein
MSSPSLDFSPDMSGVRFPRRRPDGSFCVEVTLSTSSNDEEPGRRIQKWWDEVWIPADTTWTIIKKTGPGLSVVLPELHLFADEFAAPPKVISCRDFEFRFQLVGKDPARKFWMDWLVRRLIRDLRTGFPEIRAGLPLATPRLLTRTSMGIAQQPGTKLAKAVAACLVALCIACFYTAWSMYLWAGYARAARPDLGCIYPMNNHGLTIYWTKNQVWAYWILLGASFTSAVSAGVILNRQGLFPLVRR